MTALDTTKINKNSPLAPAVDLFICGLCNYIVTPYPSQCNNCHNLYCKECIKNLLTWKCPRRCPGQSKTEDLHHSVKEVLEHLQLCCPGCKSDFQYEKAFEHVRTCDKINEESKVMDASSLGRIVASNIGGNAQS